jgi:pimeloyl-ACP methyl ester carboxylesterase
VRRLVIVEAPLPPSSFHDLDAFAARTPEQMASALPDDLRAFVAQGGRRAARFLDSIRFLVSESSLMADLRREQDIPDDALARLDCPGLCVYGDRSSCRPVGDRLARVLPRARLEVLPGGHYLHLDATADLTRHIVELLDG